MQGRERGDRQLLDAGALVGHLVPAGSMFAFLAAHRLDLFRDGDFADLFPAWRGRPSVPASVMASVLVLQVLHDCSDAEAAEAARCDLRWKVACGFALDYAGFDPSTLVYWRRRLASSDRPHRISEAVAKVITETGVLTGRRRAHRLLRRAGRAGRGDHRDLARGDRANLHSAPDPCRGPVRLLWRPQGPVPGGCGPSTPRSTSTPPRPR
jgi:hypothetical protein